MGVRIVETFNYITVEYGVLSPFSMRLWHYEKWNHYPMLRYYYDARKAKRVKTDEEYYKDLEFLSSAAPVLGVVTGPSPASFLETIKRHGRFRVFQKI